MYLKLDILPDKPLLYCMFDKAVIIEHRIKLLHDTKLVTLIATIQMLVTDRINAQLS